MVSEDKKDVSLMAWFICILGGVYYCYEYFLRITPSVMSNELMGYYHLNATQLGNLSGMYYYVYAPMQLVVGLMMDRFRPRVVLTIACLLCATGSFLFAISDQVLVAQIGRLFIGFGSAFAFVGALKLATIWLPHRRFAMFAGLITSLGMLGAVSGDVVLTKLVHLLPTWQESVFISAALGVVLAIVLFTFIRDKSDSNQGPVQESISLLLLVKQLGKICISKQLWINGAIGCLLYVPLSAFAEMWGVPFLRESHGFSADEAAWGISLVFLGWAVGGPIAGWMSDVLRARRLPLIVGSLLSAATAMLVIYHQNATHIEINVALFILGVLSGVQVIVFAVGRELSSRVAPATAVAFTNMVVMVGGMVLQPAIGKILDLNWSGTYVQGMSDVRFYSPEAYQHALLAMPIGMLLAMLLAFCLRESHGHVGAE